MLVDRHVAGRYADATAAALHHAAGHLGIDLVIEERPTAAIDDSLTRSGNRAVVVGPGSPYTNPDGVIAVIRSAREQGLPLVGT